jgi:6-phosphogluconolactonase/glucosamine-6-phosphate isomerase/deaminase
MEPLLNLGSAKVDITPVNGIPLAGFAHRKKGFDTVSHRLYARIHCFEQIDSEGKKVSALVVSADLIWWGTDLVEKLRPILKERFAFDAVLLHATHNHSGPQTSGLFTDSLGNRDEAYLEFLENRLMQGVEHALRTVEPVTIERGSEEYPIGVNRRKDVDGKFIMAPNEDGPVDPEVTVIRFRTQEGELKSLFIHYTCHPTTTDDNDISSEFPGVALERIEHYLGGEIVGAFLQGCCGDIRPFLVRDGLFYRGHRAEVEHFGKLLSDAVLRINDRPMEVLIPGALKCKTKVVPLPFQSIPTLDELKEQSGLPDIRGECAMLLLEHPERLQERIPLEITWLELAEQLSFLTFNAEMVVDYGLFIKENYHGSILPLAYTNGMIGYVPTEEQLCQGGYEARDSVPYFGLPGPFHNQIENIIRREINNIIRGEDRMSKNVEQPIHTETVESLKVEVYANRNEMGTAAGHDVAEKMKELLNHKERIRMVFAAAPSQNEFLQTLKSIEGIDWSRVIAFHMDEYIGLPLDAPQRFGTFLCKGLFDEVKPGVVHLIDSSNDIEEECLRYGKMIEEAPIDIVCLGIGENGHIAFNDPPVADFDEKALVKSVELDRACRQQQVNDGCFSALEEVPTHALTLTIPALFAGAHLFCIVPGSTKTAAVKRTLNGPISTECPSTILRRHRFCTLYVDRDSYGE